MKIGILTFHSQLNYGGVLQCWALQTVLEKMGHDVVVVDRWLDADNGALECGLDRGGIKSVARRLLSSMLGFGDGALRQRVERTKSFVRDRLKLSACHFVEWKDAPENLGVDMLVVGSDQIWHCGDFGDPRVYLLEGAPSISAIAYAASFGMIDLPDSVDWKGVGQCNPRPFYEQGLKKFRAISCRESEGVALAAKLGARAEHVVDPTLLLETSDLMSLACPVCKDKRNHLVCYFLSEDIANAMPMLSAFAVRNGLSVEILLNRPLQTPIPRDRARFSRWRELRRCRRMPYVRLVEDAGPEEFVQTIANADYVLSDSFHALMFSIVFGKNVRILKPVSESRARMFSRIAEIASHMTGTVIVNDTPSALDSFAVGESSLVDNEWLDSRRRESLKWLRNAIKSGSGNVK